jgi:hypothetical protein
MQVTFMAIVPVFLFIARHETFKIRTIDVGVPTEEYLSATLWIAGTLAERVSRDTLVGVTLPKIPREA